jgi:hypothetical protein
MQGMHGLDISMTDRQQIDRYKIKSALCLYFCFRLTAALVRNNCESSLLRQQHRMVYSRLNEGLLLLLLRDFTGDHL